MKYKITYKDVAGETQVKEEDTSESKQRLLEHAHVIKVEAILHKSRSKVDTSKKVNPPEKKKE